MILWHTRTFSQFCSFMQSLQHISFIIILQWNCQDNSLFTSLSNMDLTSNRILY